MINNPLFGCHNLSVNPCLSLPPQFLLYHINLSFTRLYFRFLIRWLVYRVKVHGTGSVHCLGFRYKRRRVLVLFWYIRRLCRAGPFEFGLWRHVWSIFVEVPVSDTLDWTVILEEVVEAGTIVEFDVGHGAEWVVRRYSADGTVNWHVYGLEISLLKYRRKVHLLHFYAGEKRFSLMFVKRVTHMLFSVPYSEYQISRVWCQNVSFSREWFSLT